MKLLIAGLLFVLLALTVFFPRQKASAVQGRLARAEGRAREHLARKGVKVEKLHTARVDVDEVGTTHTRFRQTENGVRIYGAEVITHERAGERFADEDDRLFRGALPATTPVLSEEGALLLARNLMPSATDASAELILYPMRNRAVLAYRVDVRNTDNETNEPQREQLIINANNGLLLDRWNNLQTAAAAGTGFGYFAGTVANLPIDLTANVYSLFDVTGNSKTFDYNNRTCGNTCRSTGTIFTSAQNVFGTDGSLSNRVSIGVDAHFFAQKTLEYFLTSFGRNGIDGSGNHNLRFGYMVSRTHYGNNYNNAYWDGASMTYGDGNGTTYRPFDAVDVVGHEMTHGITERTSNLEYRNEAGAANESFSDIFGTIIEFFVGQRTGAGGVTYPTDYWIGEDLYLSNNPASPTRGIRNMQDPHREGDPDHYSEKLVTTSDNGGVHTNSGIMNKMFYLLVNGGTNHADTTSTQVQGIGMSAAAKVAYYADTVYCTATDNYAKVANAWVNAAKNQFGGGSVQAQQAFNAWKACGVTPSVAP